MSEKLRHHHLERKAILYVRQSSAYRDALAGDYEYGSVHGILLLIL